MGKAPQNGLKENKAVEILTKTGNFPNSGIADLYSPILSCSMICSCRVGSSLRMADTPNTPSGSFSAIYNSYNVYKQIQHKLWSMKGTNLTQTEVN